MTYAQAKFEEKFMRRCIYKKIHYLTFDLGVKVTRNVTQYPLHHVIYASTKFEVATSNGLGGDTITRNVTDGRADRQTHGRTTDRLWYEINIPYFSNENAGIINIAFSVLNKYLQLVPRSQVLPFRKSSYLSPNSVHARFNFRRLDMHMPSQSIFVMT